ncbi:MAG: DUF58 domain-containing protein, partial [Clostridia bacterium]|nr:DUF58 domain-containing protein [Clostridia bacterium]
MLFISVAVAIVGVVLLQYFVYKKKGFSNIEYSATLSSGEVFEGDDVYLYEEIRNVGALPMPYIKIDTDLPEGIVFTLLESTVHDKGGVFSKNSKSRDDGLRKIKHTASIQSLFVLRPYACIRRRWRLTCKKRGDYTLAGVLATASDILGIGVHSKFIELSNKERNRLIVLPRPEDLAGNYTSSRYLCGDIISNTCPVTDPLRLCGAREYQTSDPMRQINWKSTASHGKLMVNVEEKTVRHRFSLLLNMSSRQIEKTDVPSDSGAIERCITLCTSILDRIAAEDVPVRFFANYPPELMAEFGGEAVADDEIGSKVGKCGPFRGSRDMIYALRMLAMLQMKIS